MAKIKVKTNIKVKVRTTSRPPSDAKCTLGHSGAPLFVIWEVLTLNSYSGKISLYISSWMSNVK